MGSEDTPFEVGLGFTVDMGKDFIGKQALLEQKKSGWTKQLLLCEVLADSVLILHDEPVYLDDKIVGHCTSGGQGFRTDKTLCLIMVETGKRSHTFFLVQPAFPDRSRRRKIQVTGFRETSILDKRFKPMKTHARVVVIGGGVMGCSLIYHLTRLGWNDVVLLEKNELTAGSTWHAAGLCTHYAHNITIMNLRAHSVKLYNGILEEETGSPGEFSSMRRIACYPS